MGTIVGNKSNKLDKYFYYIESIFILKGSKFFGEQEHNFSKKKHKFTLLIFFPYGRKFLFHPKQICTTMERRKV
jgi:hypothetical protein